MTAPPPPQPPPQAALQRERVALAWDRTGVALIVVGALFVRAGRPPYGDLRHAPGFAGMLLGIGLIVVAYRRYELYIRRGAGAGPAARLVVLTGAATVALACAALVLVVTGA